MSFSNNYTTQHTITDVIGASHTHRVQFWHATKVSFVPGLFEISSEEFKATWLTEEDIAKIQRCTLKTVKRTRRGITDEENYCTRGLEYIINKDLSVQRQANKDSVRDAVFTEQRRQRKLGCYDPMKIRNQSLVHSKGAIDQALQRGASDAAALVETKKCPAKTCDKASTISDQIKSHSVDQPVQKSPPSASTTAQKSMLQRVTSKLKQHPSIAGKTTGLSTDAKNEYPSFKTSSTKTAKRYPKGPKRASAT